MQLKVQQVEFIGLSGADVVVGSWSLLPGGLYNLLSTAKHRD